MNSKVEESFKVEDFDSIRIVIAIHNQTSETGVGENFRSFGNQTVEGSAKSNIRLVTFGSGFLVFDVPAKIASIGHILDCSIDVIGTNPRLSFEVLGKVVGSEALDDGRTKLTLNLTDYDREALDKLQGIYNRRQAEIDEFLARVRG